MNGSIVSVIKADNAGTNSTCGTALIKNIVVDGDYAYFQIKCASPLQGRYVRLDLDHRGSGYMYTSEVKVLGHFV